LSEPCCGKGRRRAAMAHQGARISPGSVARPGLSHRRFQRRAISAWKPCGHQRLRYQLAQATLEEMHGLKRLQCRPPCDSAWGGSMSRTGTSSISIQNPHDRPGAPVWQRGLAAGFPAIEIEGEHIGTAGWCEHAVQWVVTDSLRWTHWHSRSISGAARRAAAHLGRVAPRKQEIQYSRSAPAPDTITSRTYSGCYAGRGGLCEKTSRGPKETSEAQLLGGCRSTRSTTSCSSSIKPRITRAIQRTTNSRAPHAGTRRAGYPDAVRTRRIPVLSVHQSRGCLTFDLEPCRSRIDKETPAKERRS